MADDSSAPPLSRRVPGATNRPKPEMRVAPPVLPDDLIDRLRPKDADVAEAPAEQTKRRRNKKPSEPKRQAAAAGEEPAEEAPGAWYVVPDSPASPIADGNDTTQPLPVISGTAPPAVQAGTDVKPASREQRLARRERTQPGASAPPAPHRGFAQAADLAQLVGPGQAADFGKRPGTSQPDQPAPADKRALSDQRPTVDPRPMADHRPPADRRPTERAAPLPSRDKDRPRPRALVQSRAALPAAPKPVRQRSAASATDVKPLHLPGPFSAWLRRCVVRLFAALSRPAPQQSQQSLLRPLFGESVSVEEIVAAVRAQDAGRRADQAHRFRMAAVAVVLLIVMVATAVVVVVMR